MKLYNSLTKSVEDFTPLQQGVVSMYSCGPTVYNNLHIGNLSAFIYADLLRRVLTAAGYNVKAVMNITDVDDKTIRDSKRDYPEEDPMTALGLLTRKYEKIFIEDVKRIGNDVDATTFIRATETIQEMVQLTQNLLSKGFAYPAEDGIYFSIKNYEEAGFSYGQLQHIDRTHERARVSNDEYDKDSASDFALWKSGEPGEPSWEAAFTHNGRNISMPGRPGWHIECSAMSEKLLGVPFDIHTGGIDLKFPHHENEIAQSSAATGSKTFAKLFVHNNHILIDGKKMSKSLGNFYTLRDIEEKGYSPMAFRLLVLSSHYQSESNFSWDILEAAQNRLKNWQAAADLAYQDNPDAGTLGDGYLHDASKQLIELLSYDLNTPAALALVDEVFNKITAYAGGLHTMYLEDFKDLLHTISELLGIHIIREDISDEQKQLIKARESARRGKDWVKSDELRNRLKNDGIEVRDTADGTIWNRI